MDQITATGSLHAFSELIDESSERSEARKSPDAVQQDKPDPLKGQNAGRLRSIHSSAGDVGSIHLVGDDRDDLLVKSESVKNLLGKTQESRGALTFLRSREAQLGVLSMVLLVFQGTALSLVLRYSRHAAAPHRLCQSPVSTSIHCL